MRRQFSPALRLFSSLALTATVVCLESKLFNTIGASTIGGASPTSMTTMGVGLALAGVAVILMHTVRPTRAIKSLLAQDNPRERHLEREEFRKAALARESQLQHESRLEPSKSLLPHGNQRNRHVGRRSFRKAALAKESRLPHESRPRQPERVGRLVLVGL
jgi:hypothetical protein